MPESARQAGDSKCGEKQVSPPAPRPLSSGKGGTWEHRHDVEATPALCGRRRPRVGDAGRVWIKLGRALPSASRHSGSRAWAILEKS